ncbi:MAG: hypothetical protein QXT58_02160 [Archaeoglobaceae archaeon]
MRAVKVKDYEKFIKKWSESSFDEKMAVIIVNGRKYLITRSVIIQIENEFNPELNYYRRKIYEVNAKPVEVIKITREYEVPGRKLVVSVVTNVYHLSQTLEVTKPDGIKMEVK